MIGIMQMTAFLIAVVALAIVMALLSVGGEWIVNKILRWTERNNPNPGGKL